MWSTPPSTRDSGMRPSLGRELRLGRISFGTWVGAALCALFVLVALVGPLLLRRPPTLHDLDHLLEPPSSTHFQATDESGSDLLTQLCYGARLLLGLARPSFRSAWCSGS